MERTITTNTNLIEPPRKQSFRIQVPFTLRFGLIWTIVFAIIGIAIQSIQSSTFVFINFFFSNYFDWFRSFGSFVQTTQYDSAMEVFKIIMSQWYYFFYTGGLISLIWGFVSWLIHLEVVVHNKKAIPAPIFSSKMTSIAEQESIQEHSEKIEEWLEEGLRILSEGNLEEAEMIYTSIKKEYNPFKDPARHNYRRILDFYMEIVSEKRERTERDKSTKKY